MTSFSIPDEACRYLLLGFDLLRHGLVCARTPTFGYIDRPNHRHHRHYWNRHRWNSSCYNWSQTFGHSRTLSPGQSTIRQQHGIHDSSLVFLSSVNHLCASIPKHTIKTIQKRILDYLLLHFYPHCSKSSFFVQKFNFDFPTKNVNFLC